MAKKWGTVGTTEWDQLIGCTIRTCGIFSGVDGKIRGLDLFLRNRKKESFWLRIDTGEFGIEGGESFKIDKTAKFDLKELQS